MEKSKELTYCWKIKDFFFSFWENFTEYVVLSFIEKIIISIIP